MFVLIIFGNCLWTLCIIQLCDRHGYMIEKITVPLGIYSQAKEINIKSNLSVFVSLLHVHTLSHWCQRHTKYKVMQRKYWRGPIQCGIRRMPLWKVTPYANIWDVNGGPSVYERESFITLEQLSSGEETGGSRMQLWKGHRQVSVILVDLFK